MISHRYIDDSWLGNDLYWELLFPKSQHSFTIFRFRWKQLATNQMRIKHVCSSAAVWNSIVSPTSLMHLAKDKEARLVISWSLPGRLLPLPFRPPDFESYDRVHPRSAVMIRLKCAGSGQLFVPLEKPAFLKKQNKTNLFVLTGKPSFFRLPLCFLFSTGKCTDFHLIEMLLAYVTCIASYPSLHINKAYLGYTLAILVEEH